MTAKILDKNILEVYDLSQFDVDAILHSGQVFRYFVKDGAYFIVAANKYAEITKEKDKIVIKTNDTAFFWDYFDLDTDYNKIKDGLFKYEKLRQAIAAGGGIRILRQPLTETVISFIISANNNIKRFTKTLNLLCEKYGVRLGDGLFAFPETETLATLTEEDFKNLGCGYRSGYLVKTVKELNKLDAKELSRLCSGELRHELLKLSGVGPKEVKPNLQTFLCNFYSRNTAA